jgi:DNA-binding response OmpR family regulator
LTVSWASKSARDDYIPKPFNPRELLARIRAVAPSGERAAAHASQEEADRLLKFKLNLGTRDVP